MARQRGGQSGRSTARGAEDAIQNADAGDAGLEAGSARGGTLGGDTVAGNEYGGSPTGGGSYGTGSYGAGSYGSASYGGAAGSAQGGYGQGGHGQTGASQYEQSGQGGGVLDDAKQTAQRLASQAQEKAGEQVQSGLNTGKNRAADALSSVAQSLRSSSEQLRTNNQGNASRYIDQAAGRIERVANYLQQTDVNQMADQVEDFARRNPAVFLGGAFALGLVGARFLKSSRSKIYGDVPHDRAVVPYGGASAQGAAAGAGSGFDRAAGSPRASGGLADRGARAAGGTYGDTGTTGVGGGGTYDQTGYAQTDFGGTAPGTGGGDRY